MKTEDIKALISRMTLEEKAGMCSGADFWRTKAVERLGIPSVMVSDGPHGLRKQSDKADHLGVNDSIEAVCFPAGCGTAASFNRDLITMMGETLGNECQAEGVSVILGPATNIKRSPLCGRNFEYYSEDPYLATEIAGALIKGVQSKNVGTSIKHYLANNQETRRMSSSSEVDERTLREIYLAAFEGAIKKEKPWTVMCSYNRINGVYVGENKEYLTKILREEWGFDGYVVSDWGAVSDRVKNLEAGLDLEMPSSHGMNDKLIVEAVKNGTLSEEVVDQACERILNIIYRFVENRDPNAVFDLDKDHEIARKIAEETIVLLKNDGILPLNEEDEIAFIGKYAKKPRYQGGGSSHINSHKVTSVWDMVSHKKNITFAQGFNDDTDEIDETLIKEAIEAAKKAKVAVIFAGLPDAFESEGFDRSHMRMPNCQNELIRRVAEAQPNTVVVLHNGSPVEMPWVNDVKGIVEAYLGGQAVGGACTDILFGKVNPSAKLPESFPIKLEDNPSYLFYIGEKDKVEYREGIFVGYRYYDKKKMEVLFPFGHGLSYTTFAYSNIQVDKSSITDQDTVTVSVDVTNTGNREGKEVVQLYVRDVESTVIRPEKELKGFDKVELRPGETKKVCFKLDKRAFAYWNTEIHDWHVETGEFEILIGGSSKDLPCSKTISVQSTVKLPVTYTMNTTIGDIMEDEYAKQYIGELMKGSMLTLGDTEQDSEEEGAVSKEMTMAMIKYSPIRGILSFGTGEISIEELHSIIDKLNKR
ncbi:glycoside hydrolase family 3 C-terminal domain-containing protein [Lachnospiraceae bacterium MD1]|uniref:Glycoside hydrolase family 3 C-terminal domain-containing protein n=1 Tax=Variimorphobacter saccharofermentans TaxID=2755051 RepID=A0A839JXP4_9FIRM|nr:glycoside hydrolase family 3 C-terminal domain-containing protein [Variimorphobacter saccharofermentans]MBB2182445.1 glycoside hydrolase family 3 C-terminal domain-containing protein [Variimorphobacter saccharofermentans]